MKRRGVETLRGGILSGGVLEGGGWEVFPGKEGIHCVQRYGKL